MTQKDRLKNPPECVTEKWSAGLPISTPVIHPIHIRFHLSVSEVLLNKAKITQVLSQSLTSQVKMSGSWPILEGKDLLSIPLLFLNVFSIRAHFHANTRHLGGTGILLSLLSYYWEQLECNFPCIESRLTYITQSRGFFTSSLAGGRHC